MSDPSYVPPGTNVKNSGIQKSIRCVVLTKAENGSPPCIQLQIPTIARFSVHQVLSKSSIHMKFHDVHGRPGPVAAAPEN